MTKRGQPIANLAGRTFGFLTVTAFEGLDSSSHSTWRCLCECGREVVVRVDNLTTGHNVSCGCLHSTPGSKASSITVRADIAERAAATAANQGKSLRSWMSARIDELLDAAGAPKVNA